MNQSKHSSIEARQILIEPEYLVEVSNSVDMVNSFYEKEGLGTLSN